MLLLCDESVVLPLQIIFRNILASSIYPDLWKLANVTPIFKKENKQLVKNYRPISLLPICGKLFEKIVFNNLYLYLNSNNLITKNQSGFRPGDSTTNQLLYLVNAIHEAFEDKTCLEVRSVFLDISKAFDKVWHEGLLFKLKQNGISGSLLTLLGSYLQNRKQRVVLNGFHSDYASIESGVPQGSVLGPLLFLVYINDLELDIKSNVKFFADDTMLFTVIKDPNKAASDLNQDLEVIRQWAYQWKMQFNPDPTKQATEILFSCKKSKPIHPPLYFNGSPIPQVQEQKHLGLILEPGLSFAKHLNEKIKKAKRNIGIIKHLNKFLPLKSLCQMYKALVRSHLDYCDIIYHIPSTVNQPPMGISLNDLMEKVERIQYQAARAVTGTWQGSNRTKLYEELGWESLSDRRMSRRVLQIYKIFDNKTPEYLRQKLPQSRRNFLEHIFKGYRCRTGRYENSFFPDAVTSWNNIMAHFDHFPTYQRLKDHISSLIRPTPSPIFGLHNPSDLRYIFQLRVGLSHLRSHKKRHNFADTPSDICLCKQGNEDTHHFLLSCPFYTTFRSTLISNITSILNRNNINLSELSTKLLLYGHPSISDSDNKQILASTLTFISNTNRFST